MRTKLKVINRFSRSEYLPTLDGWRAIAILYVSLNHSNLLPSHPHNSFLQNGYLGVWIFFAISGLLICTRLLNEEMQTGRISLGNFYIRRLTRIQPAALVFLGVLLLLFALGQLHLDKLTFAGDLFQMEDYVDAHERARTNNWYGRHFWSLSVEEHFYMVLPFLLVYLRRFRVRIFLSMTGIILIWSYFMSRYADMHGGNVGARTDIIFTSLLIPALFAIWARRIGVAERFPGWLVWVCLGLSQVVVYSFPGAAGHELPCLELSW